MPSQEDKIKSLKIDSKTAKKKNAVNDYLPIVEMIGRKEMGSKSKQIISYDELVNTGLIAVNKLIEGAKLNPDTEYNSSYIAQSVKWAMKDEVRSRQSWYGVKKVVAVDKPEETEKNKAKDPSETTEVKTADDARKAVFEVIMSVDSMEEDLGYAPADPNSEEHLDKLALLEMKQALLKVIKKLPDNLRSVVEMRFYKNMSGNEVAEKLSVTPSRISHMIREAVKKLKVLMVAEGYTSL